MSPEEKKELEDEKHASATFDNQIIQSQTKEATISKLLLLGSGESGKSTLFKQIITIYGTGFPQDQRADYTKYVHMNTIQAMQTLIRQAEILDGVIGNTKLNDSLVAAKNYVLDMKEVFIINEEAAQHIQNLWNDPGIRTTFEHSNRFQLLDSASYLFDRVQEFGKVGYIPSVADIYRVRVRTTGIIEFGFQIGNNKFRMFDVGGQRNERKKWIHSFEGVTALIFVVAISEYDLMLFEDETVNRTHEALQLFGDTVKEKWFDKSILIVFFNKVDIFKEKIKKTPLKVCFPDYSGEMSYQATTDFIREQFDSKIKNRQNRNVSYHFTCATDTNSVKDVFNAIKDIVIRASLGEADM